MNVQRVRISSVPNIIPEGSLVRSIIQEERSGGENWFSGAFFTLNGNTATRIGRKKFAEGDLVIDDDIINFSGMVLYP